MAKIDGIVEIKKNSDIDWYLAMQFNDWEEHVHYNIPHRKWGKISLEMMEAGSDVIFSDTKWNKLKLFIKPIAECKENIE